MRIKPFMSITGVVLILNNQDKMEVGQIKLHREDLADIAIACMNQLNTDMPPKLIELCREVAELSKPDMVPTERQAAFIKDCENNAGEQRRSNESIRQYYERLKADYLTE